MGANQQHPSDTSSGSSGRERAGQASSLNSSPGFTGSVGAVGPGLGHGNGGGEIAGSLPQNQQQASKYDGTGSGREGNASAQQPHARWSHSAELIGGSSGEGGSAIQTGGGTSGPGVSGSGKSSSGGSSQRTFADGNKSLPSLKASGLLDSWGSASRDPQKQASNSTAPQQQQLLHISPRRNTPPAGMSLSLIAASQHSLHADSTELRPSTTLVMPVGLQWLANESR